MRHIRQVEADFAEAVEEHLAGDDPPKPGTDERMHITVTARCIAAAVFGAMEVWMLGEDRSLPELARLCARRAGDAEQGHRRPGLTEVSSILTKLRRACQPQPMADFDAIVVGAGHNGLTAAALLQKAGLRTLCLDSKLYAGGMASTVELFDGYKFEIAGSVQIPTSATVSRELGLDELPTVDLDVMSVSLRGIGDEPLVYYTDPMKLLTHINEVHGAEAVNGMAGLMAWCQAPTRALGRFDAGQPPKTLDEMYACATNEFERSTITDLLFGSVTDVLDRYLPDKEKHGALRGMLSLLACNTTYRGPATPGTAAALAYGFAVPDENALLVKKLRGGIGALTSHLHELFTSNGGELRLRSKVDEILVADGRVTGVRLEDGTTLSAPIVVSGVAPDLTVNAAGRRGRGARRHPRAVRPRRPPRQLPADALRARRHTGIRGALRTAQRSRDAVEHRHFQHAGGAAAAVGGLPTRHRAGRPVDRAADPVRQRPGPGAARQARGVGVLAVVPDRGGRLQLRRDEGRDGQRVIEKITRLAPNFESLIIRHTTFTPKHMGTMFGAPGGDYCHGLIHPDQIGTNRPGPKGYVDQPIPIDGLYLASAGCHGGPGITFIPGYNAAQAALADNA